MLFLLSLLVLILTEQVSHAAEGEQKIKVHIVPHSHMDAGWLSTYDEYLENWVKRIFTSVTQKMIKNPQYKFTIGDVAFFKDWYLSKKPTFRE